MVSKLPMRACALALLLAGNAAHAALSYEIGGEMTAFLLPVSGDPVATLLGVTPGAQVTVPYTLSMTVDDANVPYVENDNSVLQEYVYRDAIVDATLTLNGTPFATLRRPVPQPTPAPPLTEESRITVTNRVDPASVDFFQFSVSELLNPPPLLQVYTVPFNQTVSGTFYDEVDVALARIIFAFSGAGLLGGPGLPTNGAGLAASSVNAAAQLAVDFDQDGFGDSVVQFASAFGSPTTFEITAVPVPAGLVLLAPSLALLAAGARRRRS